MPQGYSSGLFKRLASGGGVRDYCAVLGCVVLGSWIVMQRRTAQRSAPLQEGNLLAWIEPKHLKRLDTLMEQLAKKSQQATVDTLCQLKDTLNRCALLLADGATQALAAPDDSLFMRGAPAAISPTRFRL